MDTSGFSIKLCISRKPVVFSNYRAFLPSYPPDIRGKFIFSLDDAK